MANFINKIQVQGSVKTYVDAADTALADRLTSIETAFANIAKAEEVVW